MPPNRASVCVICADGLRPIALERTLFTTRRHAIRSRGLEQFGVRAQVAREADRVGGADRDDVVGRAQRRDRRGVAPGRGEVAGELLVLLEAAMRCRATSTSTQSRAAAIAPATRSAVSSGQRLGRPSPVSTQKPE